MNGQYLSGLAYALGPYKRDHAQIPRFREIAKALQVPVMPQLMGLGSYFVCDDIYRCAAISVEHTLRCSGIPPEAIDQVLFCSSFFREPFNERNQRIGALLTGLNVSAKTIRGVTGTGCTDVLSAIDLACGLLDAGRAASILVVGLENAPQSEEERLRSYALVSDAAVSMIVSATADVARSGPLYEIVAAAIASKACDIGSGMSIRPSSPDRAFVRNLLSRANLSTADITKLFGNNLFLPVKTAREMLVGFSRSQLFLDNVAKTGHCLGCDSIMNLVDFGSRSPGGHYVLYSEAEGHSGCLVLSERTPAARPSRRRLDSQ